MTKRCILLIVLLWAAVSVQAQEPDEAISAASAGEEVMEHRVADVPAVVMNTVRSAAPDVFFNSASSYWQDDFRVYRVSGRLYRAVWNVYVREDGRLIRTESDNQDD